MHEPQNGAKAYLRWMYCPWRSRKSFVIRWPNNYLLSVLLQVLLYQCRIIKKDSQSTSVEELEQQVLKQNELAKSVDTEETKQDDKK